MAVDTGTNRTWAAGETVTAANLNAQLTNLRSGLGAGTGYTSTLAGTGWAIGNGTITASYSQLQKQVLNLRIIAIFGSTSTFGSASATLSLPAPAAFEQWITGAAFDSSAGALYEACVRVSGSVATALFTPAAAGGASRGAVAAVPMTWATPDQLTITGSYEAA